MSLSSPLSNIYFPLAGVIIGRWKNSSLTYSLITFGDNNLYHSSIPSLGLIAYIRSVMLHVLM